MGRMGGFLAVNPLILHILFLGPLMTIFLTTTQVSSYCL
jgi:hypothetical protein